jgi:hypothetical protein
LDYLVAGGDYSCNSGFIGLADPAAFASAAECLKKLRAQFAIASFPSSVTMNSASLASSANKVECAWPAGRAPSMISASHPSGRKTLGRYTLSGSPPPSSPFHLLEADVLPAELDAWRNLRETHLHQIRELFASIPSTQKNLTLLPRPSALPFLWRESSVQQKLPQIERTIIGHLHSPSSCGRANCWPACP